jgi:hypothetical protein
MDGQSGRKKRTVGRRLGLPLAFAVTGGRYDLDVGVDVDYRLIVG